MKSPNSNFWRIFHMVNFGAAPANLSPGESILSVLGLSCKYLVLIYKPSVSFLYRPFYRWDRETIAPDCPWLWYQTAAEPLRSAPCGQVEGMRGRWRPCGMPYDGWPVQTDWGPWRGSKATVTAVHGRIEGTWQCSWHWSSYDVSDFTKTDGVNGDVWQCDWQRHPACE